jgi:hypothetical protein
MIFFGLRSFTKSKSNADDEENITMPVLMMMIARFSRNIAKHDQLRSEYFDGF